jgi:chromosome segregation ATPase
MERDLHSMEIRLKGLQLNRDEFAKKHLNLQEELIQMTSEIRRLQIQLKESNPLNLRQLEHEVQKYDDKIEVIKRQFVSLVSKKKEIILEMESKKTQSGQLESQVASLEENRSELEKAVADIQERMQHSNKEIERLNATKSNQERHLNDLVSQMKAVEGELKKLEANAGSYCSRVEPKLPALETERKMRLLEIWLNEKGEDEHSPEHFIEKFEEKSREIELSKHSVRLNEKICEELQGALKLRHLKWADFRQHIAARSNVHFNWSMNQRGYMGALKYDFEKKTLEVCVSDGG